MAILHKTYGDILKEKLESVVDYNRIIWMEELWVYYTVLKKMPKIGQKFYFINLIEEEKLIFTSFCLSNSPCPLQSRDHVGHTVSGSGDLQH